MKASFDVLELAAKSIKARAGTSNSETVIIDPALIILDEIRDTPNSYQVYSSCSSSVAHTVRPIRKKCRLMMRAGIPKFAPCASSLAGHQV